MHAHTHTQRCIMRTLKKQLWGGKKKKKRKTFAAVFQPVINIKSEVERVNLLPLWHKKKSYKPINLQQMKKKGGNTSCMEQSKKTSWSTATESWFIGLMIVHIIYSRSPPPRTLLSSCTELPFPEHRAINKQKTQRPLQHKHGTGSSASTHRWGCPFISSQSHIKNVIPRACLPSTH